MTILTVNDLSFKMINSVVGVSPSWKCQQFIGRETKIVKKQKTTEVNDDTIQVGC